MDASLPRPDTVNARAVAEKPDDTSLNLPAYSKPRLQRRVDSVSWEVCRDALVAVLVWLVLFGLVLFALSMATARVRPTVPVERLASFLSSDVSGIAALKVAMFRGRGRRRHLGPEADHVDRPRLAGRGTSQPWRIR